MHPARSVLVSLTLTVGCSSPLIPAPFDAASEDALRAVGTARDDLWAVRLTDSAATELHHFDGSAWLRVNLDKKFPPRLELAAAGSNRVWIAGQDGLLWRVGITGKIEDFSATVETLKLGKSLTFQRGVPGVYLVGQPAGQSYGGPGTLSKLTEKGPERLLDLPKAPPLLVLADDKVWIHPSPDSPQVKVNESAEWKDLVNGPFKGTEAVHGVWFSAANDVFVGTGDGNQRWVIWHFDGASWNLEAFPEVASDETRRDFFSAGSGKLAVTSIRVPDAAPAGGIGDVDLLARVWDEKSLGEPVTLGSLYEKCNGTFCRSAKLRRVDADRGVSALLQGAVRGDGDASKQALFFVTPGDL